MIEAGQSALCHRVLVVDAPEAVQVSRTVARDQNEPEQVQRIIATQASREYRLQHADDIIENTGGVETLHAQIERLHRDYLQRARAHDKGETA